MRRAHVFEFTDLSWWPDYFRALLTDYLRTLLSVIKPYEQQIDEISTAISKSKHKSVIDLCSGTSGPWMDIYQQIKKDTGEDFKLFLTDKFPNQNKNNNNTIHNIINVPESIDATNVPAQLKGIRTLFNCFHHFSDKQAQGILQDAILKEEPIFIFEILQRSWLDIFLFSLFVPLSVFSLTPLIRPFCWGRLFWTYIIPIAPLVIFWDTLISNLRCYRKTELITMAKKADRSNQFNWFAGEYRKNLLPVTYLYSVKKIQIFEDTAFYK